MYITIDMHQKEAWLRWLLMREFGHLMIYLMSIYLLLFGICLMSLHELLFGIYLMFMYVLGFGTWHNFHMMWQQRTCLYCSDMTSHTSISMLLLHDLHHDYVRWQQESLLLWLLLGEYGLISPHTFHDDERGWKQKPYCIGFYRDLMVIVLGMMMM